jgi:hypothetical protein
MNRQMVHPSSMIDLPGCSFERFETVTPGFTNQNGAKKIGAS